MTDLPFRKTPVDEAIDKLARPFRTFSKDHFANLPKLQSFEPFVRGVVHEARAKATDEASRKFLEALADAFAGFDELAPIERRERFAEGVRLVQRWREGAFAPKAPPQKARTVEPAEEAPLRPEGLATPIQYVRGVGPHFAELLRKKGVETVGDTLDFLPRRYLDRRNIKLVRDLKVGEQATVAGVIANAGILAARNRKMFSMTLADAEGRRLGLKWFRFQTGYLSNFTKGMEIVVSGVVSDYRGTLEMHHPEMEAFEAGDEALHYGRIIPVYSQTEGLGQRRLRRILKEVVDRYAGGVPDPMPPEIADRRGLLARSEAYRRVHFPEDEDDPALLSEAKSPAHRRLVFDEFFALELGLALRRQGAREGGAAALPPPGALSAEFLRSLPFPLTGAQRRVVGEIDADLGTTHPMHRLLQGDVGSGKTVIAAYAALRAVEAGAQAAIMAPTEILAEQHYRALRPYFTAAGVLPALLTASLGEADRRRVRRRLALGDVKVAIGTHALIQEGVEFERLAVGVIDEQHRFGVAQRAGLKRKGQEPHLLVMTATPIPRTLSMTVYGDLDLSVLDELPPGRTPIETSLATERDRKKVYELVRREVNAGRQAYIVYPLVDESEKVDLRSAVEAAETLQKDVFRTNRVALLHGKMRHEEKDAVMRAFEAGEADVLVATTIVEVGVNVPNASVMVIEHAERFGLAQLHQLRGRVGRGAAKSYCVLLGKFARGSVAHERLTAIRDSTDGFRIAEEDLRLRGPGEVLGTRQSGLPGFRVGDLLRDQTVLAEAREEAFRLVAEDPALARGGHKALRAEILRRWGAHFADLAIG